jgi:hypothetical protein
VSTGIWRHHRHQHHRCRWCVARPLCRLLCGAVSLTTLHVLCAAMPGVAAVLTVKDIPAGGSNDVGGTPGMLATSPSP